MRLRANRLPVEGLAALAAFTATFTVSLLVWGPAYRAAVALSALFGLLGPSINHARVVHLGEPQYTRVVHTTGRLALWVLPIVHCMYVLVGLAFSYIPNEKH